MNTTIIVIFCIIAGLVAIFLALLVAEAILLVGITRNVRKITEKAQETTSSFADIAMMVGKRAAPAALAAAVAAALRRIKK